MGEQRWYQSRWWISEQRWWYIERPFPWVIVFWPALYVWGWFRWR